MQMIAQMRNFDTIFANFILLDLVDINLNHLILESIFILVSKKLQALTHVVIFLFIGHAVELTLSTTGKILLQLKVLNIVPTIN